MTAISKRQKRHDLTKTAILQAAKKIVAETGVAALSMRAIADRIDYSPSGLYEYYASKEEIVTELSKEGFDRLGADLARIDTKLPPSQRLTEAGLVYLKFAATFPELYSLMFGNLVEQAAQMDDFETHPVFEILLNIIKAGEEQGEFKLSGPAQVPAIAFGCWCQVHGMAILRGIMPEKHFEAASRLVLEKQVLGLLA